MSKQIEAMKLALEAFSVIAISDNLDWIRHQAEYQAAALREALAEQPAQQEQEPGVAVFELQESGWEIICDGDWIQTLPLRTKLYTFPQPAQPSNPLTDEQIARVLAQLPVPPTCDGSSLHDWAMQAVRVLEKNQ